MASMHKGLLVPSQVLRLSQGKTLSLGCELKQPCFAGHIYLEGSLMDQ